MKPVLLVFLAVAACRSGAGGGAGADRPGEAAGGDAGESGSGGGAAEPGVLPDGFAVAGRPTVVRRRLPPEAVWRWLGSMARTALLEAHRRGEDRLLTLESGAVSLTERSGARTVWLLPEGLRLSGTPVHLVLEKELAIVVWKPDGTRVPAAPELAVARAAFEGGRESSLVVKEGRLFETISPSG